MSFSLVLVEARRGFEVVVLVLLLVVVVVLLLVLAKWQNFAGAQIFLWAVCWCALAKRGL